VPGEIHAHALLHARAYDQRRASSRLPGLA
jgi:hypothetical protein